MKRLTVLLLVLAIFASATTACAPHTAPSSPTEPPPTSANAPENEQQAILDTALEISEVMPDNRNLVMGHEWDWIELYNPGDTFGALNGFYLTDDLNHPEALSLSNYTIDAGEYLTVVLDDEAPFQLSEMGETVYLLRDGTVISELTFGSAIGAASFDEEGYCKYPTPGFPNSEEGYLAYLDAQTLPELVISEVLSDNSFYTTDGMYYDYVELENRSDQPIDLSACYLTNSWEGTKRFYFPSVILDPGAFYTIICSSNSDLGDNHAPFEIGREEQTLYLAHQGKIIDTLTVPGDLKTNESYGRFGNIPVYMIEPTPGAQNANGYFGGIAAPTASIVPGQYEKAVTVELTGDGIIYYTLDGTRPTTESAVYSEPITVYGITTIRALCVVGERSSAVENFTYAVGVVHDLPILVISIPSANRTQLLTDINSSEEHESVMTLIENGEVKFSVPFGMRLHGNDSRKGAKKNFQLRFRGEYGAGKLEYQLFEDRDIDEYDSLLLKGGSEDYINAMVRDELATSIANGTSALYTQAMKPVVLYLGGDYWGIHFFARTLQYRICGQPFGCF